MPRRVSLLLALALAWWLVACRATPTPVAPSTVAALPSATPTEALPETVAPPLTPTPAPTPAPDRPLYELFIEPEDGLAPVLTALAEARSTLRIAMYQITHEQIIQAIQATAARGVHTRVLLEMNPQGGGAQNAEVANQLKAAGVEVRWEPRTFRFLHQKTIVVDDVYALIMTGNLTASAFNSNREYLISTARPEDVAEIIATFEADWARQGVQHTNPRLVWAPDAARAGLLAFIDAAQSSLDIEHQNMQDAEVIEHLVQAIQRGVHVRFISTPQHPLSDDADEPGRARLRQVGAQIGYLSDPYIHAKLMIADNARALVGSFNLTTNSLDFNRELSILVDDASVVAALAQQFAADWEQTRAEAFPQSTPPAVGYIDHTQAAEHFYEEATVQLTVQATYNSGRVIWLMGDENRSRNFKVILFPRLWDRWPDTPDRFLKGKTIRVHGVIEKYREWPEIVVEDPSQIEIVP